MPATVTDANVTTRKGETAFRRVPLQRQIASAFTDPRLTSRHPEGWLLYHVSPTTAPWAAAESWLAIAAFDAVLTEETTRAAASATSTLISALREFYENNTERPDRGTYAPRHTHRVLFTQEIELKTADLPRREPRAYVTRRTLEGNDAD
jgi:quinol monooxygenase YgiN